MTVHKKEPSPIVHYLCYYTTMKRNHSNKFKIVLIAAALALCVFGALSGEASIVFTKAATICMECIGLD